MADEDREEPRAAGLEVRRRLGWPAITAIVAIATLGTGGAAKLSSIESQLAVNQSQNTVIQSQITEDRSTLAEALKTMRGDVLQQLQQVQSQIAASDTVRDREQGQLAARLDSLDSAFRTYLMRRAATDGMPTMLPGAAPEARAGVISAAR